jgi:hypothetical protein
MVVFMSWDALDWGLNGLVLLKGVFFGLALLDRVGTFRGRRSPAWLAWVRSWKDTVESAFVLGLAGLLMVQFHPFSAWHPPLRPHAKWLLFAFGVLTAAHWILNAFPSTDPA